MDTRIHTSRISVHVCERERDVGEREKFLAAAYVHADKYDIFQTNSFSHVQTRALYKTSPR